MSYIINQNKILLFFFFIFTSCSNELVQQNQAAKRFNLPEGKIYCTQNDFISKQNFEYQVGDIICSKEQLPYKNGEKLYVKFNILDKDSIDPYEYGYQVLERYKSGKLIEKLKLRKKDDAYWSTTPFVRIRKGRYFADIDGDGFDEFAILPFHPGSALFGRVRIYSLKEKIKFWGEAKYHIEGDGHVLLNCPKCSKFNIDECNKCD